jgi:hypothetical protein
MTKEEVAIELIAQVAKAVAANPAFAKVLSPPS